MTADADNANGAVRRVPRSENPRRILFHPLVVIATGLVAAVVFVLILLPVPRFEGRRWHLVTYHAPIAVVFVSYLLDRLERRKGIPRWQWVVEGGVIVLALIRAVFLIPWISGHALFLSYLLVTSRFRLPWWLALALFAETVYVKVFVESDPTLIGGAALGLMAGILVTYGRSIQEGRA